MITNSIITPTKKQHDPSVLEWLLIGSGFIFLLMAAGILLYYLLMPAPVIVSSGSPPFTAQTAPLQSNLNGKSTEPIIIEKAGSEWTLTPKAAYQISARVLSRKTYHDWQSPVVPIDLALGWLEMSDPTVDEWIRWRQSGRWYYYNWDGESPYQGRDIRTQSANVHIIPATENLATALQAIQKGDIIYMNGRLVNINVHINGQDMHLRSSLTRTDSGGGACEIFYVEQLIKDGNLIE